MGPLEAFTTAWRKSFTYGGKATRAEYWWFYLVNLIVTLVVTITPILMGGTINFVMGVYVIAQFFPTLSISIRRLRDTGKEWHWIFINFVPFIGGLWFLYLLCQPTGHYAYTF